MKNVLDKICGRNQNTYFMLKNFLSDNLDVYEMWKNMVEPERPQAAIY
jgi:hypothetical protein